MIDQAHPSPAAASYDEVPYESEPLVETHPDSLAAAATLLGIDPPSIETCHVLELGSALGDNLLPMAASLPRATFVGVDASTRQIEFARQVAAAAGLTNITLASMDLMDVDERLGKFDYIICHGVYSWVPPHVQQKILDICSRQLSERGIAYVSYNTYPGWHTQDMVRQMLRYRVRHIADSQDRIAEARRFIELLAHSVTPQTAFARSINEIADLLRPHLDSYLYHEFLEDVNDPLYLAEFVTRASAHGLKFIGEAWLRQAAQGLSREVAAELARLAPVEMEGEQAADFVINRGFRRSMLCRDSLPTAAPSADRVTMLSVGTLVRPTSAIDLDSSAPTLFQGRDDLMVSAGSPLLKAALGVLSEAWPGAIPFDSLWREVSQRLSGVPHERSGAGRRHLLAEQLLAFYRTRAISLHAAPLPLATRAGQRPQASALARHQAASARPVTDLRHGTVELSPVDRFVLVQLDGATDVATIEERATSAIKRGAIDPPLAHLANEDERREAIQRLVAASLENLAHSALLQS